MDPPETFWNNRQISYGVFMLQLLDDRSEGESAKTKEHIRGCLFDGLPCIHHCHKQTSEFFAVLKFFDDGFFDDANQGSLH